MSQASEYYTYRARAREVVDGDTLDLFIDQGFNDYKKITVRLRGVDTDEIFFVSKDTEEYRRGMEQKEFVEDFVGIEEHGEGEFPLSVRTFGKGKYGRWIAYIWRDGDNLTEELVEKWPETDYPEDI